MKKLIAIAFLLIFSFTSSVNAYELTSSDYTVSDTITSKIESIITHKGESYRKKYIKALEKLKGQYRSDRIVQILEDVIDNLNGGSSDLGLRNIINSNLNINSNSSSDKKSTGVEGLVANGKTISWKSNGNSDNKYLVWIFYDDGSSYSTVINGTSFDLTAYLKKGNNKVCVYGNEKGTETPSVVNIYTNDAVGSLISNNNTTQQKSITITGVGYKNTIAKLDSTQLYFLGGFSVEGNVTEGLKLQMWGNKSQIDVTGVVVNDMATNEKIYPTYGGAFGKMYIIDGIKAGHRYEVFGKFSNQIGDAELILSMFDAVYSDSTKTTDFKTEMNNSGNSINLVGKTLISKDTTGESLYINFTGNSYSNTFKYMNDWTSFGFGGFKLEGNVNGGLNISVLAQRDNSKMTWGRAFLSDDTNGETIDAVDPTAAIWVFKGLKTGHEYRMFGENPKFYGPGNISISIQSISYMDPTKSNDFKQTLRLINIANLSFE